MELAMSKILQGLRSYFEKVRSPLSKEANLMFGVSAATPPKAEPAPKKGPPPVHSKPR